MALFLLVRAVFVALTHMAPSPIDPQKSRSRSSTQFFTAATYSFQAIQECLFLAALAFWHIPQWRIFYLVLTAFFGSVVLLGHYHYSIDVLAALFITSRRLSDFVLALWSRLRAVSFLREPRQRHGKSGEHERN